MFNFIPQIPKQEQGFTLAEMLVTLTVASILVAVSVPSLVGFYQQQQVKDALEELQGALQEAQRQAMRKGQSCTVNLGTANNQITSAGGCLLTTRILPSKVTMSTNINSARILFSYKGNTSDITTTPSGDQGTVVISRSDGAGYKRCLVITNGLGIMRTGFYDGSTTPISSNNCTTLE
jgi:prepilin-type N-terminal cleavage/methylation domain-containing protein